MLLNKKHTIQNNCTTLGPMFVAHFLMATTVMTTPLGENHNI